MTVAAIEKSLKRSRARSASMRASVGNLREKGVSVGPSPGVGQFGAFYNAAADRERYNLYKGTVYAAVNALAFEAAGQPVCVGRLNGAAPRDKEEGLRGSKNAAARRGSKRRELRAALKKMPRDLRHKAAAEELEILPSHPFLDAIDPPNPVQGLWQFVYSFVANLCLTGWSYVIHDVDDGKDVYYSLPTTWVTPIHDPVPFAKFKITNPSNPGDQDNSEAIDREHVGFAYLPNPADPLAAYAPAQAQIRSIRVDDNIQTSQEMFFENGIFPSVIVSIGNDPHPDVPGDGTRPRLTGAQRRQVTTAIRKAMGGIAQFGNPAIVDGLIESIERLSMDSTEMGWDKSEDKVRDRILTAFGVHPYILGHPNSSVGSHAQMFVIEQRFYKRVNSYLAMLGSLMTEMANKRKKPKKKAKEKAGERLQVWWEECVAVDQSIRQAALTAARANDDISQDELRAELGFPPDEDRNQQVLNKAALPGLVQILGLVAAGTVATDQAASILTAMGLPDEIAAEIAGVGREAEIEATRLESQEREDMQMAASNMKEAVKALQFDVEEKATLLLDFVDDTPLELPPVMIKGRWDDYREEPVEDARARVREEAEERRAAAEAENAPKAEEEAEEAAKDAELTRAEQQAKIDEILARIDAIEAKTEQERAKTEAILADVAAGAKDADMLFEIGHIELDEKGVKWNPNQPRVPAGQPGGGQWGSEGGMAPDRDVGGGMAPDRDVGGGGATATAAAVATIPQGRKVTEDEAKKYVAEVADIMTKAGLEPYVSPHYSDSQLRGLQSEYTSNSQNWQLVDGDNPKASANKWERIKTGEVGIGVAVWGKKLGISRFEEVYDPESDDHRSVVHIDEGKRTRVGQQIGRALEKRGVNVTTVRPTGYDAGWGSGDVGYFVVIKKDGGKDKAFNPNQPRVPAGSPEGGRFASNDAAFSSSNLFREGELNLPIKARQPLNTKEAIYNAAREAQYSFENGLNHGNGVDKAIGADVVRPDSQEAFNAALDSPGPTVIIAPLKGEKRAIQKVTNNYAGDWSRLGDVVRATVAVESKEDIPATIEAIRVEMQKDGWELAAAPDNRIEKPAVGGYRDIQTFWRGPNGHIAELQINTKAMIKEKEIGRGHALYEEYRDLAGAKDSVHTPETLAKLAALEAEMERVYEEAWNK